MFNKFFSKNYAICEIMLKNAAQQKGHGLQYNMAYVLCMLFN